MKRPVVRPIFIVGSGRSGTTVLYELLCRHPDLAWFSNYTSRFSSVPVLAAVNNLYPRLDRLGLRWRPSPVPTEGYPVWDRVRGGPVLRDDGPLTERDATDSEAARARRVVAGHLRFQGKRRFVNKNTRNVIRMRYLRAFFPDALFVHVLRDPRAVVASMLEVAWWPELAVWCFEGLSPREWASRGCDTTAMAAGLWRNEVAVALADKEHLEPGCYREVHYENLVQDPVGVLRQVLDFADLPSLDRLERVARATVTDSARDKYRRHLTREQIALIEEEVGGLASGLGYSVGSG